MATDARHAGPASVSDSIHAAEPDDHESLVERIAHDADADAVATVQQLPSAGAFRQVTNFIRRSGRRIGVTIVGGLVLLAGIALLVLPGPAFLVIPAGLAILATEYAWARRWLDKAKAKAEQAKKLATRKGR
jgi:Putative transmembrane protein (PGPGW)